MIKKNTRRILNASVTALVILLLLTCTVISHDVNNTKTSITDNHETKNSDNDTDPLLKADFDFMIDELTVEFNDNSTGDILSWMWEFGDENTSQKQNPIHTYNISGNYTVTLTIANNNGTDNISKNITVQLNLILEFEEGLGIRMKIKNNINQDIVDVDVDVRVEGGMLGLVYQQFDKHIPCIPIENESEVIVPVFGLGFVDIDISIHYNYNKELYQKKEAIVIVIWVVI